MSGSTFILGSKSSVLHNVVRFGPLRFWAENGSLHLEDDRDNSYAQVSLRRALERMRAISDMLGNSSKREIGSEDQFDRANRKRHQDMLDGMVMLCKMAHEQGEPDAPDICQELERRRPKTVVVPGVLCGM